MTKFTIISITSIAIAGTAASLIIHYQSQSKLQAGDALLQEQSNQLAALTVEHRRLSNLVARASSGRADDHMAELARLRTEGEALKKQTNDLGQRLKTNHVSQPPQPASSLESHPPEYYEQLRQMAGSKPLETRDLGRAFGDYASDHQNQSPTSLDQLAPYLAKLNSSLSGTNQFEFLYQGSLDKLQGLPWGSVAVIREKQTWPGPNGEMMRVYGFPGGLSQMMDESSAGFQSWAAQHVISSPKAGQSGQ
jgi:hypothetical protein